MPKVRRTAGMTEPWQDPRGSVPLAATPNPRRLSAYKRLAAEVCRPRPGARCHLCDELIVYGLRPRHPLGPSADHIEPLSNGGALIDPNNLRLAHYGCNADRGAKPIAKQINRSSIWD